jgi:hypothetical protein
VNKKSSNVSSAKTQTQTQTQEPEKKGVAIDLGSKDDSNFERI